MICTSSDWDDDGTDGRGGAVGCASARSGLIISHGFDDESSSCDEGSRSGDDFDILLLLSSGVRDRLCVRFRLPLTKLLELLLEGLQESTTSTAATGLGVSTGLDSGTVTGAKIDAEVEGLGDSTRVIRPPVRCVGELGTSSGGSWCFWLAVARVIAPTVRTRFGDDVAVVGERELWVVLVRLLGVVAVADGIPVKLLLLLQLLLPGEILRKLVLLTEGPLLQLAIASEAAAVLVAIVVVGRSLIVVFRAGLVEVGVLLFGGSGVLVGVDGGDGFGCVPAAPTFDFELLSPHIGSKCFNFHGSSLLFSFSASVFSFIWFSGVNSPSANRSRHSRQARAKNSLFKLDGFNRIPFRSQSDESSIEGRSTEGNSWTNLY